MALEQAGMTVRFTSGRASDYGDITRFGVEELVADNVLLGTMDHASRQPTSL